jgi:translation initiation factor IF-3
MAHPEFGEKVVRRLCDDLADVAVPESPAKMMGRMLSVVLAPGAKKKSHVTQTAGT